MNLNILIVGAHPDDVEIGLGASVAKFLFSGHKVTILDLTDGEPTPFGDPETRSAESAESTRILGCPNRITLDLKNRELVDSIDARHKVATIYRKVMPDILFIQGSVDAHPDHVAASSIAQKARFDAKLSKSKMPGEPWWTKKLFRYDVSHLRLTQKPSFILDVSETFEIKLDAVRAYKSQFLAAGRDGKVISDLRNKGAYYGSLIGKPFGEPVFCDEEIGLSDINAICF